MGAAGINKIKYNRIKVYTYGKAVYTFLFLMF